MFPMTLIDPRQTIWLESGYALDAIGAMSDVDLPRKAHEPDHPYRQRLSIRLWEHRGPTNGTETAPQDEPKPNHVRDAVWANQ
jgi:hypothetical protein